MTPLNSNIFASVSLEKFPRPKVPITLPTVDNPDQLELLWMDENRQFLLRQTCPVCGGLVYVNRYHHPLDGVTWQVACSTIPTCIETNPMKTRELAFDQWNAVKAFIS